MRSLIISCFVFIIILSFTFNNNFSQAKSLKKLNSAVVVGTICCHTCIQEDYSEANHFISGALVAMECGSDRSKPTFSQEAKTNENGEFEVRLPFSVTKHVKKITGCSVKLLKSNDPFCTLATSATSATLRVKSRKQGTYVFSAGLFTFKPLNKPEICNQKPGKGIKSEEKDLNFPPPIQDPEVPFIPPIPDLPQVPSLPNLPPLPPIPKIPTLPSKTEESPKAEIVPEDTLGGTGIPQNPLIPSPPTAFGIPFPPNPFQPPPSIFPPNPFQPPPSIFPPIPNPLQPPPSIFPPINFPPLIPGLIPSPPPPQVFPIPPFPFPPVPGFPGSPPPHLD